MKFDHIIINPPYCRNLHLKILNETVVHSDDVVCIHPARWLEDALWKEKPSSDRNKFSHLVDHINSVILLNSKSFNRYVRDGDTQDNTSELTYSFRDDGLYEDDEYFNGTTEEDLIEAVAESFAKSLDASDY